MTGPATATSTRAERGSWMFEDHGKWTSRAKFYTLDLYILISNGLWGGCDLQTLTINDFRFSVSCLSAIIAMFLQVQTPNVIFFLIEGLRLKVQANSEKKKNTLSAPTGATKYASPAPIFSHSSFPSFTLLFVTPSLAVVFVRSLRIRIPACCSPLVLPDAL